LRSGLRDWTVTAIPTPGRGPRPDFTAGVYPLLEDETTWFLAADFDEGSWQEDARAYLAACQDAGVPAALERSRSGRGGHVWVFFSEAVPAHLARRLGGQLITRALDLRPELGMGSYDRLFPSQDTMPAGGFGNLIALPLQRRAREQGNSLFVDDDLRPFDDQWAFLFSIERLDPATLLISQRDTRQSGGVLDRRRAEVAPHPGRSSLNGTQRGAGVLDQLLLGARRRDLA